MRLGLAFVVLIFRDDGYGVIRWKQERQFGRTAGVEFGNPDFVALARAFGCEGVTITAAKDLRPALDARADRQRARADRLPRRLPRERPPGRLKMGAPKWPPYPRRSERPGGAVSLLCSTLGAVLAGLLHSSAHHERRS